MSKRTVVVIGSGPAGLLAVHAATMQGAQVRAVLSPLDTPSPVHGATYLHKEIPELDLPDPVRIRYNYLGTSEHYADKIYGPGFDPALTSWGRFGSVEHGWSMLEVYSSLWVRYAYLIQKMTVRPGDIHGLVQDHYMVVNTAPLINLVNERDRQHFRSEEVICSPIDEEIDPNTIIYNGLPSSTWYRQSNLFGIKTREYQLRNRVLGQQRDADFPGPGMVVRKPVSVDNGLDPLPGVLKVGRFGGWNKQALADDAFFKVHAALEDS